MYQPYHVDFLFVVPSWLVSLDLTPDSILEFGISDLSSELRLWFIGYPLILRFNIPPSRTTYDKSSLRKDLKDTRYHELEINFIEMNYIT